MLRVAIAFMLMALGAAAAVLSTHHQQADELVPYFLAFLVLGILSFGVTLLERDEKKPVERLLE